VVAVRLSRGGGEWRSIGTPPPVFAQNLGYKGFRGGPILQNLDSKGAGGTQGMAADFGRSADAAVCLRGQERAGASGWLGGAGKEKGVVWGLARLFSHSKFQMSPEHTLHPPARLEILCVPTRFILRCPMATLVMRSATWLRRGYVRRMFPVCARRIRLTACWG